MKISTYALFLFLLLSSSFAFSQESIDLPFVANWKVKANDTLQWMNATVPGCVHSDLESNGIISNPLIGTNEALCQWVESKDWIYETVPFDVPDQVYSQEIIRLHFTQIDTYAKIFLNDTLLLITENVFRSYEIDVKPHLKKSGNILRLEFYSPIKIGKEKLDQLGYPLPGDPMRAVTRKPQYHYGWDWGPRLVTSGITGPIIWHAYSSMRVDDVFFEQVFISPERVELNIQIETHGAKNQDYTLTIEDQENNIFKQERLEIKKGPNNHSVSLTVKNPKLWWCNGLGDPYQYTFKLTLQTPTDIHFAEEYKIGFRNIELITDNDSYGETFYFKLNGVPVFAKGANYIPITMLPAKADRTTYQNLLSLCKDTHFNMLRVWGGGYYEQDDFYELCDSLGIMVWQDFMFACSMYPGNPAFLNNVRMEAEHQTKRLRNHACMAVWCGNNENAEGWQRWGWQQGLSKNDLQVLQTGYDDLFTKLLPAIVYKNHPQLNYWESSPRFGRGDARSITEGDSHYWGLWHDEEPFEILLQKVPRFMSEFGMQSFPNEQSYREILTNSELSWDDPGLLQHQKHNRGNKLMRQYMERWYDINGELKEYSSIPLNYLKLTQSVQAEGMIMGIEAQRRAAPYCMGTLFWQLNDVWPAFSWSAVDYKMEPKLFMHALEEVYAPELISPIVEDGFLHIHYVSDIAGRGPIVNLEFEVLNENQEVLLSQTQEFISLKDSGVKYSERWEDLMGSASLDNLLLVVRFKKLDGSIYLTRKVKLQGKSSKGIRYQLNQEGELILTNISD